MNRIMMTMLIAAGWLAGSAEASEALDVRLKRTAAVLGTQVTLGDVLQFGRDCDDLRKVLGPEVIASELAGADEVTVTYQQVHERMQELGVNLGLVLLQGASKCVVEMRPAPTEAEPESAALFGAPQQPKRAKRDLKTLADHVRAYCQREWDEDTGTVELDFERGREDLLGFSTPTYTFVIKARTRERLGMREFRVMLRRNGRTVRTESVFANVRVKRAVLVAARPLNHGRHIKPDDLTTAERIFASEGSLGLVRSGAAVGQRLKAFVPEGEMVRRTDLEEADLVKRSAAVQVYSNGSVGVRMRGTALDAGTYGEQIRVRIGDSRSSRRVVHGEVTGIGEVRLVENNK